MKLLKFFGLLIFMVILDFQASAQNCNPAACKKAIVNVERADVSMQSIAVKAVATSTAVMSKICDPTDCPPECLKICKIDCCKEATTGNAQVNQVKQVQQTRVQPLEARPSLLVKSSVVGAD